MDSTESSSDIKIWILLAINILLLVERVVKGAKVIKCNWHGCLVSNVTPPATDESNSPIKRRKKKETVEDA
jgi:hypothetical protein